MAKKIKLIFFHPYNSFGGADRSIIRLINGLNNNKYEIVFLSLNKNSNKKFFNKKIKFYELKSKRTIFSINEIKKIVNYEKVKYNKLIFISNQNFANIVSCLALNQLTEVKLFLIERNHPDELKNYKNFLSFLKNSLMLSLMKILYKKSDKIIGISRGLSKDLSKMVNKKVITIYNPASDKKLFKKIREDKINLNQFKGKKIILNVGFLESQKDQMTLLKAFLLSREKYNNLHLIIIGRGTQYHNLIKFVNFNNLNKNVSILTNIMNPTKFYKIADLFVLTSIYEGFANVIVEALSMNCPVISSDCNSGPKEILQKNKFGKIFPVGNYATLSKKIIDHFNNPLILKNKTKLFKSVKKYNLKNYIKAYESLFNE